MVQVLRKTLSYGLLCFALCAGAAVLKGSGWEFSLRGEAAVEGWYFPDTARDGRQKDSVLSTSLQLDLEWSDRAAGRRITLIPYARLDSADAERNHMDLREFNLLLEYPDSDLLLGVGKVFWGTTEAVHWVDVVNQVDLVEDVGQEERLGQPMVNFNKFTDHGRFSFFVLPGFRERSFPGKEGRLRTHPRVQPGAASYESSREWKHIDWAMRWSHTIGNVDIGLSHFWGTVREPIFNVGVNSDGEVVLIPHYDIVHQFGVDGVWFKGDWLIKFEFMSRHGQGSEDFFRFTAGPEYTFWGAFGTRADVDVFAEILYDSQGGNDINPFEHDVAYGFRLRLNDLRDTTLQMSAITDLKSAATFFAFEGSMRVGQNWMLHLEARAFAGIPTDDFPLNGYREDHHFRLITEYRF